MHEISQNILQDIRGGPSVMRIMLLYYYSTVDQVCARALVHLRFQYSLKCALNFSAHVLRFQHLHVLTYRVRTKN